MFRFLNDLFPIGFCSTVALISEFQLLIAYHSIPYLIASKILFSLYIISNSVFYLRFHSPVMLFFIGPNTQYLLRYYFILNDVIY